MELFLLNDNKFYYFFEASLANEEKQVEIWTKLLSFKDSKDSLHQIKYIMRGFNNEYNQQRQNYLEKEFFDNIKRIYDEENSQYSKIFFRALFPKGGDTHFQIARIKELLNDTLKY